MGRLLKKQIDRIKEMRDEGYTQKEIADTVRCGIRTVRKYWRRSPSLEQTNVEERLSAMEESIKSVGELLFLAILSSDFEPLYCPQCEEYTIELGGGWIWECTDCSYTVGPIPMPTALG